MVGDVAEIKGTIRALLDGGGPHVVVVPVEREADLKVRRGLDDTARAVCAGLS